MHIAGRRQPEPLASDVKAVWDAIRAVRSANSQPAGSFGGSTPTSGHVTADLVAKIVGQPATDTQGVTKVTIGGKGAMAGMVVGGSMGLTTWAAFSGSDTLAAMDGDFMITAGEVQPVLRALRRGGIHIVALHGHMIGEQPDFYFTHFWATGSVQSLAQAFRAALDAQASAKQTQLSPPGPRLHDDTGQVGQPARSHARLGENGWLSFGGPAGQIALMHRELVEQRRWISDARFLHALSYCMLLPGPEAQQLAIYIGWLMHRTRGGVIAGTLFVLPGISSSVRLAGCT